MEDKTGAKRRTQHSRPAQRQNGTQAGTQDRRQAGLLGDKPRSKKADTASQTSWKTRWETRLQTENDKPSEADTSFQTRRTQ